SGAWKIEGHEKQLEFGLKAIEPAQASRLLARALGGKTISASGPWIELVGSAGGPAELRALFDQVLQESFDDVAQARALTALGEAARLRGAKPSGDLSAVM